MLLRTALRRGRRPDPGRAVPPGRARGGQRADGLRRRRPRGRRRAAAVAPRRHRAARRAGAARRRAPRGEPRRATTTTSSPRWPAATTRIRRSWRSPRSGCGRSARCSSSRACTRRSWASSPTRTIEYVCVRCAGVRREVAEAELAAWVGARPGRAAAHEVLHYLQRVEDPAHRELALHALAQTGAAPATARARGRGGRAPERGAPAPRGVRPPPSSFLTKLVVERSNSFGGPSPTSPVSRRCHRRPHETLVALTLPPPPRRCRGAEQSAAQRLPTPPPWASSWMRARCSGPRKLSA